MKIPVYTATGEQSGREAELPDNIFGIQPSEHSIYLAVKAYLAAQRQGTHKAKERGEITGSTKKLHRQKGTGGSRKGDIKNPIFRSGGRIFGPRPRKYNIKLNRKVRQLARASAFSSKTSAGGVKVVEELQLEVPKTKEFIKFLNGLDASDSKVLFITGDSNTNLYRSGRNLPKVEITHAGTVNTYDIMRADTILLTEGAIEKLKEQFAAPAETTTTNG